MIHPLFSQPLISTSSAHLISLALGTVYVGSLYLSKNARLSLKSASSTDTDKGSGTRDYSPDRPNLRDDPDVVRARLAAVSMATVVCCTGVFAVVWGRIGWSLNKLDIASDNIILRLGFSISSFIPFSMAYSSNIYPHLVTPILFLGPLFAGFLSHELPGQRNWRWQSHVLGRFCTLHGLRNYWVGPITEEIVFRACILAVYHMSGASKMRMIFFGPLVFGLAHVHHAWDTYLTKGRNAQAAKVAILGSLFQLAYTTLFGFYVSYLFLRTGSILPPITAHIFCNIMGLPQISYELRRHPNRRGAIKLVYVTGIVGFIYTLGKWTRTEDSFYWPSGNAVRTY